LACTDGPSVPWSGRSLAIGLRPDTGRGGAALAWTPLQSIQSEVAAALRYPDRLSHLVLLDTGGDSRWAQENAPRILAGRGFSPGTVRLARRFLNGRIAPREFIPALIRLGSAYNPHASLLSTAREMIAERRTKMRPEALIFAGPHLLKGWTVMDRLGEIKVPTLVMAGRDDFLFPPEHQAQLAAGIPNARLRIIERAGHNPHSERPAEVMKALRDFIPGEPEVLAAPPGRA
jgi:proline iminopeptidase